MTRSHPLLLALTVLLTLPTLASAEEIVWLDNAFPPFYIEDGPDAGHGIADEVLRLLQAAMPDDEHVQRTASPSRITRELAEGEHACSAAFIRTPEREEIMAFSLPDMLLPSQGVTVLRTTAARLGDGPVSLEALIRDPDVRVGVAEGRSYGAEVDALIEAAGATVVRRPGEDIYEGLLEMLVRGRLDAIIGYPYEATYVGRRLGVSDEIVSLPLEENANYLVAHVVCPKTDWGRRMIERIDAVLLRERPTDAYRGFVERWLDPENVEDYRRAYDEILLDGDTSVDR